MDSQKPEPKSDEIDLAHLLSGIGNAFRRGWLNLMRFLANLRRIPIENRLSFILIILASVSVGVIFSFFVRKHYYESTMILSSDYLNTRLAENIIDKLDILTREKSKHGLAVALGIPDTLADKIRGFKVKPFVAETDVIEIEILKEQLRAATTAANQNVIEEVAERIELENRHSYAITVQTLSPQVISQLQNAIVNYFQKNPYIAKRVEANGLSLIDMKGKLEKDINKMDSLKGAIYQAYTQMSTQSKGSNNVILGDKAVSDPVQIFNHSIGTYDLYEEVSRDLHVRKDFEVVDGFTAFNEPANPSIFVIIIQSLLIGVVVAYLDVALRRFNMYLANLK